MKSVSYYCDYTDTITGKVCAAPSHRVVCAEVGNGVNHVQVNHRHVCSDPIHIGTIVDDTMYDYEKAKLEAKERHPSISGEWSNIISVIVKHIE